MTIEPFSYGREALEALEQQPPPRREIVVGFTESLMALRCICERVALDGEDGFRAARLKG